MAVLALGALAIGVAWGWGALFTYLVLAAIAGAVMLGARVGGDWITGASRGRFDDDHRGRR